mmetsp:Transcript_11007/g.16696  ORF Transcript_11007/g.16696 Transcript_11007/m.16696 type:complete len:230 (+) Transcript_11007:2048-2737(+)
MLTLEDIKSDRSGADETDEKKKHLKRRNTRAVNFINQAEFTKEIENFRTYNKIQFDEVRELIAKFDKKFNKITDWKMDHETQLTTHAQKIKKWEDAERDAYMRRKKREEDFNNSIMESTNSHIAEEDFNPRTHLIETKILPGLKQLHHRRKKGPKLKINLNYNEERNPSNPLADKLPFLSKRGVQLEQIEGFDVSNFNFGGNATNRFKAKRGTQVPANEAIRSNNFSSL